MSWKDTYKNRITTAEKAIKAIKDNDHVVFSEGAGFPQLIGKTLAKCHQNYPHIHIHSVKTFDGGRYMKPDGDTPVDVVAFRIQSRCGWLLQFWYVVRLCPRGCQKSHYCHRRDERNDPLRFRSFE